MKKYYLLPFCFTVLGLSAQELPYTFSAFNETYVPLSEATSANGAEIWDDPQYVIPIGFTVDLMGESVDQLIIIYPGSQVIPSIPETEVSVLLPYIEDIMDTGNDKSGSLSPILYKTEGNPGSRIFKLEWQNVGFYDEWSNVGTFNNTISFQVWLYETTNDVEYRFGNNSIKDFNNLHPLGGVPVGIAKNVNIDTGFWEGLWLLGGDPANPTVYAYTDPETDPEPFMLLSADPQSGQVYHFDTGIVNVGEFNSFEALKLFPTESDNIIHVNAKVNSNYNVFDSFGNLIRTGGLSQGMNDLSIIDLASGIYFIKTDSNYTGKFIRK
jgi:hypothetical protein